MSIDLAMEGYGGPIEMPKRDEEIYPEFHYCGEKELGLPDEGVMEIKFCKVSEESRTNRDGKTTYSCTIAVKKILEVEGEDEDEPEAPATSGTAKNTEEALDKILKTMEKMVAKDEEVHDMIDKKSEDEGENGNGKSSY